MKPPPLTLGIEEEYQIIDPVSRELKSGITQILKDSEHVLHEQVKAEMHQSMVEVGTEVCRTPAEARAELIRLRREVMAIAGRSGLTIVAAGTHPFSAWSNQEITPFERYLGIKQDMQDLAQEMLIFGTHVHVGIDDPEFRIDAMNVARYFAPHVLCLSASSPFWMGRNTGLHSYRSILFRHFPRSGVPPLFHSAAELDGLVNALVRTHCIPDATKLWWDIRPNSRYPTLEFRVCDVCTRIDEAICVAAIFQALIAKLWKLRRDNLTFRLYPLSLIEENKWRAVRYGLSGKLLDLGKQEERPARDLIREFIQWFLDDVLDELGTRKEVEYAFHVLEHGSSSERQVATFERTGKLEAVVDQLVAETAEGVLP